MESALAQLDATVLQRAIESPQLQQDNISSLTTLISSIYRAQRTPTSAGISDKVTDHEVNESEVSGLRTAPSIIDMLKPDTKQFISRISTKSRKTVLVFTEESLFRNDHITSFRDQFLRWRQICAENNNVNSLLDRIVAAASCLKTLKDEEVGSIPLEMTYFYLFNQYQRYKLAYPRSFETILRRLHAEDWDNFSDRIKGGHRAHLEFQLAIGRRWAFAVDRLSYGVILLAGKKLSSLM